MAPGPPQPQGTTTQQYDQENIRKNMMAVTVCRTGGTVLSGVCAGILGLESYRGFLFFLLCSAVISGGLFVFAEGNPTKYFLKAQHLLFDGIFDGLFTFVLFWTLFYGLVHVY
eukprot:m.11569 g.11569  ORF g.11569 m.11569 type:complete len:113 (+) comp4477_c0_seq1:255-593(+)